MSYEDTNCPCGERKTTDTMLCDACVEYLKDCREMEILKSDASVETRRHAATILLAIARKRKNFIDCVFPSVFKINIDTKVTT